MPIRCLSLRLFGLLAILAAIPSVTFAQLGVTPPDQFKVPDGFEVELVYEVPGKTQGSWVSLAVDPNGGLVACDQEGSLYRVDVSQSPAKVEPLGVGVGSAQGILFAFDSLYVNVNARGPQEKNGVYRLQDTTGDGKYDKTEHILPLVGGGEHGPHALILSQDGKRVLTCAGNMTKLPSTIARSRVPQVWQEDHLLPRMPDARGHAANRMAPGGWIGSFAPDGSDFELIASGFRNEYDIALNRAGELFSYDADMEWDVGTPWYRPTRVNHVISGAEFGWRNGTGKWPEYQPDSFGAAVNIGPGSPTGICFGYGAKFPKKYESALFIADWSYGNIHAVMLEEDGSTYTGSYETFATAAPLPVTDMVVRPEDGALYFAIGGRKTQSGLYRIVYRGEDAVSEVPDVKPSKAVALRKRLESFHAPSAKPRAVAAALKHLAHDDRAIRFAARTALEHQPLERWRGKLRDIENDHARALAVIALARVASPMEQSLACTLLGECDWQDMSSEGQIALLRAYSLVAIRLGEFSDRQRQDIVDQVGTAFPTGNDNLDRELAQMLVYLDAPDAVIRIIKELKQAPSQENQIHYALVVRNAKSGWTESSYRDYFQWFNDVQSARGGMSFGGFINNIKNESVAKLDESLKTKLAGVLSPPVEAVAEEEQRSLVKQWTVDELVASMDGLERTPDFENGKKVFSSAQCYKCHRMGIQGGILGPDLTGAGGRFSVKDLIVAMVEPNKTISDQYGATQFLTDEGKVVTGRVVNMSGDKLRVMTNMLDPSKLTQVDRNSVEETRVSKTSMMPGNLLDTFTKEEIADLIAYLRAGGKAAHPIYRKSVATK